MPGLDSIPTLVREHAVLRIEDYSNAVGSVPQEIRSVWVKSTVSQLRADRTTTL